MENEDIKRLENEIEKLKKQNRELANQGLSHVETIKKMKETIMVSFQKYVTLYEIVIFCLRDKLGLSDALILKIIRDATDKAVSTKEVVELQSQYDWSDRS